MGAGKIYDGELGYIIWYLNGNFTERMMDIFPIAKNLNGLVVLFIFYSFFEIAVRVYVCKLLFNMAIKRKRDIATREEIIKAPLIIIGFFVFTFIFEFIVYAAAFRPTL